MRVKYLVDESGRSTTPCRDGNHVGGSYCMHRCKHNNGVGEDEFYIECSCPPLHRPEGKHIMEVTEELTKAKSAHPGWPMDMIHQVAIMAEECGESVRAALNVEYEKGSVEDYREEVIQTIAMGFRCLEALDGI